MKARNIRKAKNTYNKVNENYENKLMSLKDACGDIGICQNTYYRACKLLNEKSIVLKLKNNNKKNKKQYGGDKQKDDKYKLVDNKKIEINDKEKYINDMYGKRFD